VRLCVLVSVSLLLMGCEPPRQQAPTRVEQTKRSTPSGELPAELAKLREPIEQSKLEFVRVKAKQRRGTLPWQSKFRGQSYLPNGGEHPMDVKGRPLVLLVQINFADVPKLDGYPTSGILQLFISGEIEREQVWGLVNYDEKTFNANRYFSSLQDQRYYRVIFYSDIVADASRLTDSSPMTNAVLPVMEEAELSFERAIEHVSPDDYRFKRVFGQEPGAFFAQFGSRMQSVWNEYAAFAQTRSLAKIGGYASFVQRDPRSYKPTEDWLLLLEIQSSAPEDGVEVLWGDDGVGGLFIRREDLLKRDFSKVAYYWDNH